MILQFCGWNDIIRGRSNQDWFARFACPQTNRPAGKYRRWKFIHAPSYTTLSGPFSGVIRARTGCRHLEHVARAMRDDSFQFLRPRKTRIPTRQFLAEIGASWRGASWETGRPRVKSRASPDNSLFSHASARTCFHFRCADEGSLVLNSKLLVRRLIADLFVCALSQACISLHLPCPYFRVKVHANWILSGKIFFIDVWRFIMEGWWRVK